MYFIHSLFCILLNQMMSNTEFQGRWQQKNCSDKKPDGRPTSTAKVFIIKCLICLPLVGVKVVGVRVVGVKGVGARELIITCFKMLRELVLGPVA